MSTIRFIVNSIYPRNAEENVPIDAEIRIVFSNHMNKETVEDSNRIQLLRDNTPIDAKYEYIGMQKALTITPYRELKTGETYRIKIKGLDEGPRTIYDSQLEKDITYYFITKDGPIKDIKIKDLSWSDTIKGKENLTWNDSASELDEQEVKNEEGPTDGDEPSQISTTHQEEGTQVLYDPLMQEQSNLVLEKSFPSSGDLLELDSKMILVFNKDIEANKLQENIFVKKSKLNSLLEDLSTEELIKGTVTTQNETEKDKTLVFQPSVPLEPGTEYELVIKESLSAEFSTTVRIRFHTLFKRMFADVDTVRLVLGQFAERLTDLELAKLINQQSNSIYQLASMMPSFDEAEWPETGGVIIEFPYAASQYVVYSTAYYAILGQSLEGSSGISESIKLADLSVSGSSETSDNLSDLLELLKAEYERWWDVLQGKAEEIKEGVPNPNRYMVTATRAGNTPYPDFQTRVPFEEIGGTA